MDVNGRLRDINGIYHIVIYWIEDGKQKSKSFSTKLSVKGNKSLAKKMLNEKLVEYRNKKEDININTDVKFIDFLENAIENSKNNIEESTYYSYRSLLNVMATFFSKNLLLKEVSEKYILDYYEFLSNVRKVSNNTIVHHHVLLRKYLDVALNKNLVNNNIMYKIKRPRIKQFIPDYYNNDNIKEFLNIIRGNKYELEFYLAIYYGLRRSEILGINLNSIDFKEKTLIISTTVTKKMSNIIVKKRTKTKKSYRILPLIDIVEEKIKERLIRIQKDIDFYKKSYNFKYKNFICVRENGDLVSPELLSSNFQIVIKKNNLKKIRFHDLRHSCATLLYKKGVSLKDIQMYLGHSNISTTANIYSHFDYSHNKSSADIIKESLKNLKN